MTIFVYVNTSKQVGDPISSRSSQMPTPRRPDSGNTIPKAWPFVYQALGFTYSVTNTK